MRTLIFLAALTVVAAPALADPSSPATPKPAKGSPEEVVCHREEVTGSLAQTRRTCMTRAQWAAQSDANQQAARDGEDHARINSVAPQ